MHRLLLSITLLMLIFCSGELFAGTVYQVTSKVGDRTKKYHVKFGGGITFHQFTALSPNEKKFVYVTWD